MILLLFILDFALFFFTAEEMLKVSQSYFLGISKRIHPISISISTSTSTTTTVTRFLIIIINANNHHDDNRRN